jgi:hypothetical protein
LPRSLIIAALCLALIAPVMPAAAAARPPLCEAMAAMAAGSMPGAHGGAAMPGDCCAAGAAGQCCLEEAPSDCRPLALSLVHRPLVPAPAPGAVGTWTPLFSSRPLDAPRPQVRAPSPLYLTHASLLI